MRKIFDGKASLCFVKGWEGVNYVVVESPASSIGGKEGGGGKSRYGNTKADGIEILSASLSHEE